MRTRLLRTLVFSASIMAASSAAAETSQFLRRPDIHGDQVVFTSEGDLWLGSVQSRIAMRITSHEGVEGPARFSPDGKTIAFTAQYDGGTDVYVMDATGGVPRRLTYDPTAAIVMGFSADGREVLFRSRRGQPIRRSRLWAVPVAGGSAHLLPIPYGEFVAAEPGGKRLAYVPVSAEWQHWKRYQGGQADDVWLTDATGKFRRLTDDPGVDTEPVWVGSQLYVVSERDGHANLYLLDSASGAVTAATHYSDYDVRYPGADGSRVVFEHGDGLAIYDTQTKQTRELPFDMRSDRIHTRERRVPALKNLADVRLGPAGKRLLVSARGRILSAPVDQGDVREVAVPEGGRAQYAAWSADGKQVAFVSDASGEEQVWTAPSGLGGVAKQLTRDHRGPLGPLVWSPDGARIATSDREMKILLVDAKSGAITTVDQADRGGSYDVVNDSYRFSPDGKWLVFTRIEPNWNGSIILYDIAHKTKTTVSNPEMNSSDPAFDPDGKYLYFLSDRAFDPRYVNVNRYFSYDKYTKVSLVTLAASQESPFLIAAEDESTSTEASREKKDAGAKKADSGKGKAADTRIDLAGLRDRIVEVPVPADRYVRVEPAEGRLLLETYEDVGDHGRLDAVNQLRIFDMKKKEVNVLAKRLTDFQLSGDRKKLLIQNEKVFTLMDASADKMPEDKGKVPTENWTITIDPRAEWKQMFGETWRIARDFFYDPGMHGVDWDQVRSRFERQLPAVADRSDLTFILGEMVAELNCGHAYVGAGDVAGATPLPMGFLGADVEPVTGSTPAYRVTKIYPGDEFDLEARSPLVTPGIDVKPGDYILAVAGRPVRADQDLQALLVGTAERAVSLTVNHKPSFAGAREVRIKPMASERIARYYDWVASKREYVRTHGGESLGYVHIPNMGGAGLQEFAKHYYPNLAKDGMIYDVRFNGGGYIDAMLLLQIASNPYSYFKPRYGASWTRIDWGFNGHRVALCNENSGSDAEEFSDAFQRLKLGPVIGARTWGGEVGSGDGYPLADGGAIYIPNYGEWVPEGKWVIEGTGVKPDIEVADDPAALMAGRDPQLDRAIEYLKAKLKSDPVSHPTPPPFPHKALTTSAERH